MISSSLYTDEWADNSPIRGSATADLSPSKVRRLGVPPTRTTSRNTPIPIGDLLLLPRPFNAGHNDDSYEKKLPHYLSRTSWPRSLHPQCYERNAGFVRFLKTTGLPFTSYESFTHASVVERSALYRVVAQRIWNPAGLLEVAKGGR